MPLPHQAVPATLQRLWSGTVAFLQPLTAWQESTVQALASSQFLAAPGTQAPDLQASLTVQTLLSVQPTVLLTCAQPVSFLQLSSVQPLPSLQASLPAATQAPPLQPSPVVQASPSVQAALFAGYLQPATASQVSSVQTLPSEQARAAPGVQLEFLQMSLTVHLLLSLQDALLAACLQPVLLSHESLVQLLPSSQF